MFFLKLLLLLLYFALLLIVFYLIDQLEWNGQYDGSAIIDPFSLSVKQLQWLLHLRGISYNKAIEKSDLKDLIAATGAVTNDEIKLAELVDQDQSKCTEFTSVNQLEESLQQAEVWLIQVIADGEKENISPSEWKTLVKRTNLIGVYSGKILCKNTPQLCDSKSFFGSQLLLSYHHGGNHRQYLHSIHRPVNSGYAFNWISSIFNQKVSLIPTEQIFQEKILEKRQTITQIIYVSPAEEMPAVLGSLQFKLNKVEVSRCRTSVFENNLKRYFPNYNITSNTGVFFNTPQGKFLYGANGFKGDHINFQYLSLYLMMLTPDINLFFTLSVYICSFLGALSVFTSQGYIVSRGISVVKSLFAYNFILLGTWLVFSGANFEFLNELLCRITELLQQANSTETAGVVRAGVVRAMQIPVTFLVGFVVFFNFVLALLQKLGIITYELEYELSELLYDDGTQTANDISHRWIQRLATPELWLQPLIPNDYIDELPVWEFSAHLIKGSDESENDRSVSAHRTSSTSPRRSSRDHSRGRPCFPAIPRQSPTITQGFLRSIRSYIRGRSPRLKKTKDAPKNMRNDTSCAICLDNFMHRVLVCGLPCNHVFHQNCILEWLYNDKHCCPVCRWPAFKPKSQL